MLGGVVEFSDGDGGRTDVAEADEEDGDGFWGGVCHDVWFGEC
jgi:hypothetical protein